MVDSESGSIKGLIKYSEASSIRCSKEVAPTGISSPYKINFSIDVLVSKPTSGKPFSLEAMIALAPQSSTTKKICGHSQIYQT